MDVYTPSQETDLLLLQWWGRLIEEGDFERIFSPNLKALSAFLSLFQAPNALFYERDAQGIAVAVWFNPALSGALLSLWARTDWRKGRWKPTVIAALREVFTYVPVVLFVTQGPHVMTAAQDFGFTVGEQIPGVYLEQPGTMGWLSKAQFEARYGLRG